MTRQPALFSILDEKSASDRASLAGLYAQVLFNRRVDQPFTYAVPLSLANAIAVGKRVRAPLGRGNKPAVGYCIELSTQAPDRPTKPLLEIVDDEPILTPALLQLTQWMASYYFCNWGQVLDAVVPAGAKAHAGTRERTFVEAVQAGPDQTSVRLTRKQQQVLELLRQSPGPVELRELARAAGCGLAVVQQLIKKGYAAPSQRRVEWTRPANDPQEPEEILQLNPDQLAVQSALEQALQRGGFQPFLLHGVTGSGKTEIYLQAIAQTVRQGREAIVLVPEISLTPQTVARFRGRFPHVAVLHSHLSNSDRGSYWRQIAAEKVQVVVGARSAVFAPTRRLGLIVVDEEHEHSFKQETTPRYHARDVAVMRAHLEGIPIVLGSATPSLESWHNARRGQYRLLSLPQRVLNLPLPDVHLIDLRHEPPSRGRYRAVSPSLQQAMQRALDQGGQVILLLNRRGFSTYICCPACGHVVQCRFCDVSMTHHRERDVAMCHYCGYEQAPPERCPECGLGQIRYLGQGTEKLEAEIAQKFPGVPMLRMDSDTMRRPGSHAKALAAFRQGEVRILLGTQMIAKGLDFPNVTLVGVVNADLGLHIPDFRSAERTFQLLAQVAGRTGRGPRGGRVLVQTFNPEHAAIALAAQHDYRRFAELELRQRQEHLYPPFSRMARIVLRGKDQTAVESFAQRLAASFRSALETVKEPGSALRLLGPAEAPLFRLKGYYRYHFQIQSSSSNHLRDVLRHILRDTKTPEGVDLTIDVDPYSLQ